MVNAVINILYIVLFLGICSSIFVSFLELNFFLTVARLMASAGPLQWGLILSTQRIQYGFSWILHISSFDLESSFKLLYLQKLLTSDFLFL